MPTLELQTEFDKTMKLIFDAVPTGNPSNAERAGATQAYLACAVLVGCKSYRIPANRIQQITQRVYTFLGEQIELEATKASN